MFFKKLLFFTIALSLFAKKETKEKDLILNFFPSCKVFMHPIHRYSYFIRVGVWYTCCIIGYLKEPISCKWEINPTRFRTASFYMKKIFLISLLSIVSVNAFALDVKCKQDGEVVFKVLNGEVQRGLKTFKVTDEYEEGTTKFLYNGDFFKMKWPITVITATDGISIMEIKYFADHGSKNVNYGSVEVTENGLMYSFSSCISGDSTY